MSSGIKLAINVSPDLTPRCRTLAIRSCAVRLVDDIDHCSAVLTDDSEIAASALDAGTSVLVLNPFGLSEDICQRVDNLNACMPAHTRRFQPSVVQVKHALDSGRLGDAGLLRIHCWNPDAENTELFTGEVDLAVWMFGCMPNNVYSVHRPGYRQVHLGFDSGGMAIIDFDSTNPGDNDYYSLSMIGSAGAAYADDHHNANLLMDDSGTKTLLTSQYDAAFAAMIDHFARSAGDGKQFPVNWRDTIKANHLAGQAARSAEQQNVVAGECNV
ncbi:MAG: hypothetical protein MK110_05785 [Fuerstiella sp.]|nr:hypothetical protein [Fuerstiella sp.]